MLQPRYTMQGFEWKDQRGLEGIGFVRALRSLMTAQLPMLLPSLRSTLEKEVANELYQSRKTHGKPENIDPITYRKLSQLLKEPCILKSSQR